MKEALRQVLRAQRSKGVPLFCHVNTVIVHIDWVNDDVSGNGIRAAIGLAIFGVAIVCRHPQSSG